MITRRVRRLRRTQTCQNTTLSAGESDHSTSAQTWGTSTATMEWSRSRRKSSRWTRSPPLRDTGRGQRNTRKMILMTLTARMSSYWTMKRTICQRLKPTDTDLTLKKNKIWFPILNGGVRRKGTENEIIIKGLKKRLPFPSFQPIIFRRLTGGGAGGRARDNNETRSQQDKWNLLPKIWKSLGREVREGTFHFSNVNNEK